MILDGQRWISLRCAFTPDFVCVAFSYTLVMGFLGCNEMRVYVSHDKGRDVNVKGIFINKLKLVTALYVGVWLPA